MKKKSSPSFVYGDDDFVINPNLIEAIRENEFNNYCSIFTTSKRSFDINDVTLDELIKRLGLKLLNKPK